MLASSSLSDRRSSTASLSPVLDNNVVNEESYLLVLSSNKNNNKNNNKNKNNLRTQISSLSLSYPPVVIRTRLIIIISIITALFVLIIAAYFYSSSLVPFFLFHHPFFSSSFATNNTATTMTFSSMATSTIISESKDNNNNGTTRTTTKTRTTSTTKYGEVWLIRHGEKDDYHIPLLKVQQNYTNTSISSSTSSSSTTDRKRKRKRRIITAMYELNQKGWNRANHLKNLVAFNHQWPKFHGLYATRPPSSNKQIWNVYPNFVRDKLGQSLVKREYQTLLPISKYLNRSINTNYTKSEIHQVAFDITKSATAVHNKNNNSSIILVSWDHCSLPTLIVTGFGCTDHQLCFRCWSDQRFGDVLKLNVSFTTTTTVTTTTSSNIDIIISNDDVDVKYVVSSTIISMTGEGYKPSIIDQYYYKNNNRNSSSSSSIGSVNVNVVDRPVSIEKSTPCLQSYCTARPAAATLVTCLCYNNSNNNIGNGNGNGNDSGNSNVNGNSNSNSNGNGNSSSNTNTNSNINSNSSNNSNNNWITLPPYNNNNQNRNWT